MTEYEIYETVSGKRWVNIGQQSYLLPPIEYGGGDARTLAGIRNGDYGPLMEAYAKACDDAGVPLSYSWEVLGDHVRMTPPWKAKPYNYERE